MKDEKGKRSPTCRVRLLFILHPFLLASFSPTPTMPDLHLFKSAIRDALRPTRLLTLLLLIGLPTVVGVLWRMFGGVSFNAEDVYGQLVTTLVMSFALTILSVVYATGIISQELEQRTIVYLLTRPVPRWRILLAKFAASLAIVITATVLSATLLAVTMYGPTGFWGSGFLLDLRALVIGAIAYGALFLFVATFLPRPLIYALLFVFGWETLVPTLPGSFARLSVMSYLRVLTLRPVNAAAAPTNPNDPSNFLQSFGAPPKIDISNGQAWLTLTLLSAICLVAALLIFSRREYVPREDAE